MAAKPAYMQTCRRSSNETRMETSLSNVRQRFATIQDEEYEDILQNRESQATRQSTKKALNILKLYLQEKQLPQDFETLSKPELNALLRKFYLELRKCNGDYYKTASMNSIRAGICRYLKDNGKFGVDIIKDTEFVEANIAFKASLLKLKSIGKGETVHHSDIDENDLNRLYSSGVLNDNTPQGLQHKVWFELMLYRPICQRGRENLRKLTKDHFSVGVDSDGKKYVFQARDELTKKVSGDDTNSRVDGGRMYATGTARCPVASFEKYISKLHPGCDALFQTPKTNIPKDETSWYYKSPVGETQLGRMMSIISKEAGLSRVYTNHCLRSTCISILDYSGFASREICSVSGHQNESSITGYARRVSDHKKLDMSSAISSSLGHVPEPTSANSANALEASKDMASCSSNPDPVLSDSQVAMCKPHIIDMLQAEDWDTDLGKKSNDHLSPDFVPSLLGDLTPADREERQSQRALDHSLKTRLSRKRDSTRVGDISSSDTSEEAKWTKCNQPSSNQTMCLMTHTEKTSLCEVNKTAAVSVDVTDAGCQTNNSHSPTGTFELQQVKETAEIKMQLADILRQVTSSKIDESDLYGNDEKVQFYTGLPNFQLLMTLFYFLAPHISSPDRKARSLFRDFILVLMHLRLYLPLQDLAYRFNVSVGMTKEVFDEWINVMDERLRHLIVWPERGLLRTSVPNEFISLFGINLPVIVECFEIPIDGQISCSLPVRTVTWSLKKQCNTVKFLRAMTPHGFVAFLSKAWGGRIRDHYLIECSGVLNNFLESDIMLQHRSFAPDSVRVACSQLDPLTSDGKKKLSPIQVNASRISTRVYNRVESVAGALGRKYKILEGPLPFELLACKKTQVDSPVDKIVRVCCSLSNMCPPVLPKE